MILSTGASMLGYAPDARLLIINVDDFGICHASNEATLRALVDGVATSASLMPPCPWAPQAMQMLRNHPRLPFGVHLTLICEFPGYRWDPVSSQNQVPSLIDEHGCFPGVDRRDEMLARADLREIEAEFRLQIETVLAHRLSPTHLDWHCLADGGRDDIFDLTLRLAREYGLALRVHDASHAASCRQAGLPVNDHPVLDSYRLDPNNKAAEYARLLRSLPAGLNEWALHPSLGNDEAKALEPHTWPIRRADLEFLLSREARAILDEEGITLIDYRPIQAAWANGNAGALGR